MTRRPAQALRVIFCLLIAAGCVWSARFFSRYGIRAEPNEMLGPKHTSVGMATDADTESVPPRLERYVRGLAATIPAHAEWPIPAGAQAMPIPTDDSSDSTLTMYRTRDSMSAVTAFFSDRMPRAGWTLVAPPALTHGWLARFSRNESTCVIHCAPDAKTAQVFIMIRMERMRHDGRIP